MEAPVIDMDLAASVVVVDTEELAAEKTASVVVAVDMVVSVDAVDTEDDMEEDIVGDTEADNTAVGTPETHRLGLKPPTLTEPFEIRNLAELRYLCSQNTVAAASLTKKTREYKPIL
jgi:hypothetical protein